MTRLDRRELLRAGGRVLAVAAGVGIAGCGGVGDGTGERTPFGVPDRTTTATTRRSTDRPIATGDDTPGAPGAANFASLSLPEAAAPTYRQWLPRPSTLFPSDGEGDASPGGGRLRLSYARPFWVNALRPDVPERFARDRRRKLGLDHFGIGFDRYQWVLRIDRWTAVLTGRFDPADVVDTLLASGYGRAGTHHGVALLAREDGPRAVAVADGALAWSSAPGGDPPVGAVRALFDAKAGRVPRYHETDEGEGFATLTEATGGPLVGRLFVDAGDLPIPGFDVEGVDGWGTAVAFDGATTYLRTVVAFDRPKDPETVRLKLRSGAAGREFYRTADAVDVTADERSASVVAAVADERYADLLGAPETDVTYPQVTWGYDRDPAADEVTVTHRGGDEVPAGSLRVTTPAVPDEPSRFADEYDAVGPGDSLAVAVPPSGGGRIRILWSSSAGARRSVLDRYEVPGDDQSGTTE